MLPVNMPQSAPYAAGPLSGYFGGAMFNNAEQNQQLNAQQEDIQNQTMQHALDQLRLGDPLLAAQRQVQMGQQGIEQTQMDSGAALKLRQAQDQAKQSKAFTDMSNDEITHEENARAAAVTVSQHMDEADYLMNPEKWRADKAHLEKVGGAKGLPDVITPDFIQKFKAQTAGAEDDLKTIRARRVAEAVNEQQVVIQKLKNTGQIKAAEAGFKSKEALQENMLPDDVKVLKQASDEFNQNGHVLSESTYAQAYNVLKNKNRADPAIAAEAKTTADQMAAFSEKDLPAAAKKEGVDPTGKDRGQILREVAIKTRNDLVEQQTKDDLAQRFPDLKVKLPDGRVVPVATETKRAITAPPVTPAAPATMPPNGVPLAARDPSKPLPPGGGAQVPAQAGPRQIKSAADYQALPPGPYLDPDGILRNKK